MVVYQIKNTVNGMKYTGATKRNVMLRYGSYKNPNPKMVANSLLKKEMLEMGRDNFVYDLVINCNSEQEMYSLEKKMIKETIYPNGYNFQSGGRCGTKIHKETKAKIAKVAGWNKGLKTAKREIRECVFCLKKFESLVTKGSERKCCSRECFKNRLSVAHKGKPKGKGVAHGSKDSGR